MASSRAAARLYKIRNCRRHVEVALRSRTWSGKLWATRRSRTWSSGRVWRWSTLSTSRIWPRPTWRRTSTIVAIFFNGDVGSVTLKITVFRLIINFTEKNYCLSTKLYREAHCEQILNKSAKTLFTECSVHVRLVEHGSWVHGWKVVFRFRYSFICQGTSTRRQRRDLFGLRVKLPLVSTCLTTQR